MKTFGLRVVLGLIGLAAALTPAGAQQTDNSGVRFAAIDVFIDSSEPLAAWQFELRETRGLMTVVGVENGESPAFANAPYYDLEAVDRGDADKIIVADFNARSDASLPVGDTRIATIHVRLRGSLEPDYELRLIAAGDSMGRPVDAAIRLGGQDLRR